MAIERSENGEEPWSPKKREVFSALLLLAWFLIGLTISLLATRLLRHTDGFKSLSDLSFYAGATTQSFVQHRNFDIITTHINPQASVLVLRSARMPVIPIFLAVCWALLGPASLSATATLKTFLSMCLLAVAAWPVFRETRGNTASWFAAFLLLLAPFCMTAFLADVINLPVEEGYLFAFLAVAVSLILFTPAQYVATNAWVWSLSMGILVDLIYLTKSSMLPASCVLACVSVFRLGRNGPRLAITVMVIMVPILWGFYQFQAGGRFTTGTSLDGVNLHKGNNEYFLQNYPPPYLSNLDFFDDVLNRGTFFTSEWQYSDWHKKAAMAYIRSHPKETAIASWRKFQVCFFTLQSYGSGFAKNAVLSIAGMILFRVLFWSALASCVLVCLRRNSRDLWIAIFFLVFVAACTLPYLVGFCYIRHISVLIFPSCLLLCKLWLVDPFLRMGSGERSR